jgi:hypothetical protein
MERIILIGVVFLASLFFNFLSSFLPMAGRQMVEVVHAETRLVEVAPGYEGWYQHDGETVRDWSSVDQTQVAGKFQDEEDEDANLEDGNSDDSSSDDGKGEVDDND